MAFIKKVQIEDMKKEKYFTEVSANEDGIVRVCNRKEGAVKGFSSFVQLQIETDDEDAYVSLRDEQVDELIEALRIAKTVIE